LPCPAGEDFEEDKQQYTCGSGGKILGAPCENYNQEKQDCDHANNVICDYLKLKDQNAE
jgi:hypothetical protein